MKKGVVLLSGGIDSTTLLYKLIKEGHECYPLTILYGQRHEKETLAARDICRQLGLKVKVVDLINLRDLLRSALTGAGEIPEGRYAEESMGQTVVPNRNMIFLAVAAGYAESTDCQFVAYAAHGGDHALYPDCRPEFVKSVGETIELGTGGAVELITPFIDWTKADIVSLGLKLGVPYGLTWSCYKGGDKHCGRCGTCIERREAFEVLGLGDPWEYEEN